MKWWNYPHRDNSWVKRNSFSSSELIDEWNALSARAKKQRQKRYEAAMAQERVKAKNRDKLAGLTLDKIRRCAPDEIVSRAYAMLAGGHVKSSKVTQKHFVTAIVRSAEEKGPDYKVTIRFSRMEQGTVQVIGNQVHCSCRHYKRECFEKGLYCKHIAAVLLDRCVDADR